jgi:hypothetical protein
MTKLVTCLMVLILAGATSLAAACDLQCSLHDSAEGASDAPCHSEGPHPAPAKHEVHSTVAAKAPGVLPVLVGTIQVFVCALATHESTAILILPSVAAASGSLVLRI